MDARDHLTDVDLVRLLDGEAHDDGPALAAHVEGCDRCRQRHDALAAAMGDALGALRNADDADAREHAHARAALAAQLALESSARPGLRRVRLAASLARWSTAAAAIAAVLLTARALRSRPAPAPIDRNALPIAALTPGATSDLTVDDLCHGPARGPEPADPAVRQAILRDYGMSGVPDSDYELDYLITPALGGANDRHNLWPERYTDRAWNAKVKDQLEDLLPALVCAGRIDLRTAQRDIAVDWIAAYKKYFKTDVPLKPGT